MINDDTIGFGGHAVDSSLFIEHHGQTLIRPHQGFNHLMLLLFFVACA
ncbi:hypothetical protein LC55x_5386 [Lysobacter capsici]|nr:hypothetical protein LC55x_5386 [Lysobacter capsici]